MLPHFAHIFLCKLSMGNCGTSATAPFVPTLSGRVWRQSLDPKSGPKVWAAWLLLSAHVCGNLV